MDQITHTVRHTMWHDILLQCQNRPCGMSAKQWIDIVNIGLHFFLKNVRPYAASCNES